MAVVIWGSVVFVIFAASFPVERWYRRRTYPSPSQPPPSSSETPTTSAGDAVVPAPDLTPGDPRAERQDGVDT